tara:strand:- start:349 stop:1029 length:681 start_codon:yes stop_codon:yes gene_type:complete
MRKLFIFLILLIFPLKTLSHTKHYKNINKIEMEILKDGKVIGFCNYKFFYKDKSLEVQNTTKFEVKIFGVKVFSISSNAVEKYKNDQLIYFKSETMQNDKKKFVNLKYEKNKNNFLIHGSSYKGTASLDNVVGNWWNHKILKSNSQISPLSGSIKKQVVTFIGKEKIDLYGKEYFVHRFKLKSKDLNLSEDKKLDFDIWFDPKRNLILKVAYKKMGYWEYKLKNLK